MYIISHLYYKGGLALISHLLYRQMVFYLGTYSPLIFKFSCVINSCYFKTNSFENFKPAIFYRVIHQIIDCNCVSERLCKSYECGELSTCSVIAFWQAHEKCDENESRNKEKMTCTYVQTAYEELVKMMSTNFRLTILDTTKVLFI